MTGVSMPRCCSRRRTSKPSMPGISRSSTTQSIGSRARMSSACIAASGDDRVVAADAFQIVGVLLGHRRHVIDHQHLHRHVRSGPRLATSKARRQECR